MSFRGRGRKEIKGSPTAGLVSLLIEVTQPSVSQRDFQAQSNSFVFVLQYSGISSSPQKICAFHRDQPHPTSSTSTSWTQLGTSLSFLTTRCLVRNHFFSLMQKKSGHMPCGAALFPTFLTSLVRGVLHCPSLWTFSYRV